MAVEALKVSLGSRSYFSFFMEIEKAHHLLDGGLFFCLMVYMVTRVLWVRPFSFSSFIDGIIYFY